MFGKFKRSVAKSMRAGTPVDRLLEADCSAEERAHAIGTVIDSAPLFARLRPSDRRDLGAVGVVRSYPAGAELVKEGQRPGVGLYIILRGRVRLTQRIEGIEGIEGIEDIDAPGADKHALASKQQGQAPRQEVREGDGNLDWEQVLARALAQDLERDLATLGPGEMFGEMALLDERPRSATATAIEPTLALVIPIVDFRAALSCNPEAAVWLAKMLSRRVRQAEG